MKGKRRRKVMIVVGVFMVIIGGILIYWNIPYSPGKASFTKQMQQRVEKLNKSEEVCTAEEIEKLPEPLQRYALYIGLENYPKYKMSNIKFANTKFVFDANSGKVLNMDYDLWLFNDQPYRSAFCSSSMYGVPFEGLDYCTEDKQGGMKGILGKAIRIFDVKDDQGYKAVLISWVAEGVTFNPAILVSPYLSYEVIDRNHVKATITYNGVSGTGIFTINDDGAITEFYSDERQVEEIDGVKTPVGWRCEYRDYIEKGNTRQISKVRCVKVFPVKEVVYFDSDDFIVEHEQ
ncbi:MAG: hypothetical protein Q4G58_11765 [bacterium]|nr:hypothetical protein [bacterium]